MRILNLLAVLESELLLQGVLSLIHFLLFFSGDGHGHDEVGVLRSFRVLLGTHRELVFIVGLKRLTQILVLELLDGLIIGRPEGELLIIQVSNARISWFLLVQLTALLGVFVSKKTLLFGRSHFLWLCVLLHRLELGRVQLELRFFQSIHSLITSVILEGLGLLIVGWFSLQIYFQRSLFGNGRLVHLLDFLVFGHFV